MIQFAEKGSPHVIEDPCFMPVSQAPPTRGRAWILPRKILPSCSGLQYPEYSLKARPIIRRGTAPFGPRRPQGNELFDLLPLFVGQHRFTHTHRTTSDQCVTRKVCLVQVLFSTLFQKHRGFETGSRYLLAVEVVIYELRHPKIKGRLMNIAERGIGIRGIEAAIGETKTFIVPTEAFYLGFSPLDPVRFVAKCKWARKDRISGHWYAGFEIIDSGYPVDSRNHYM
jgi:hypothetical protein